MASYRIGSGLRRMFFFSLCVEQKAGCAQYLSYKDYSDPCPVSQARPFTTGGTVGEVGQSCSANPGARMGH